MIRRVLIVGASRGIGKALLEFLSAQGHVVFGASRSMGGWDVQTPSTAKGLVAYARASMQGLDAVVMCAGVYDHAVATTVFTNVVGSYTVSMAACQSMESGGSVVLLAGGGVGGPNVGKDCPPLYAATKAAVVQLAECLAQRYPNVRINAVAPGAVDTGLTEHGGDSPDKAVRFIAWLLEQPHITGRLLSAKWDTPEMWANPSPELGKLRRVVG
jgi:NAD(P)-dependent dehydrogenase (short-subunit alcohol dehydrogenase family)